MTRTLACARRLHAGAMHASLGERNGFNDAQGEDVIS